jgi:DnaJ family protein C protein 2
MSSASKHDEEAATASRVAGVERAGARRWLERMNSKLREGGKKEEKRRLKEFMENAYRCDPRVIARREEQKAERCAPRPRLA